MLSKKCAVCGKEFFPRKNKYESAKYCSNNCRNLSQVDRVKDDLVRLALEHEPFFNINNLVTLCADCHYKEHRQKKQQEINFD